MVLFYPNKQNRIKNLSIILCCILMVGLSACGQNESVSATLSDSTTLSVYEDSKESVSTTQTPDTTSQEPDSFSQADGAGENAENAGNSTRPSFSETTKRQENASSGGASGSQNGSSWKSVNDLLQHMTLREKICQMLILSPEQLTGVSKVTAAGATTQQALQRLPVGGILYNTGNMVSKSQVRTMLSNIQSYSKIPLILTCDEEGGRVARLMKTVGTTYVGPMFQYRDQGTQVAYQNARTIAADMRALGFNVDMAPVADVWSNPQNTVIGDRAYSDSFSQGANLIPAAVRGFHSGGVGTTLKHFPGHGDTVTDSHNGAVYVSKTLEQIRREELLPFQTGIDAGSDMVMIGHLTLTQIDPNEPATFSYRIVTQLLREEMGFQGVVITDGLQMKAITNYYSSGDVAVRAVRAGVDILLCPDNPTEAVTALEKAVSSGQISQTRIDQSVRRILTMKVNLGILTF